MKFKGPCRWSAVYWYSTPKRLCDTRLVEGGPCGSSASHAHLNIRDDASYLSSGLPSICNTSSSSFDAYETIKLRQDGTEVREYFKWNDEGCCFEECQRPPALRYSRKVHACVQFVKGHLEI